MKTKRSVGELLFDIANPLILILFSLTVILPLLHVIAGALSSSNALTHGKVYFWPQEWTLSNIELVIKNKEFWVSLKNSVIILIVGTTVSLIFTFLTAYPLSKSYLPGRRVLILIIVFTMIFHAPLIPLYLLVKNLGMLNTLWSIIIPPAISGFNLILCMTFLRSLPEELFEAARIDGMKESQMLWRIALPLSMPIVVTLLLFYAVGLWNSYFMPLLFITDRAHQPLQVYLYRIIAQADINGTTGSSQNEVFFSTNPESVQMATVVLATLPIVVLYPFLQKHFIKGATLGSVKE